MVKILVILLFTGKYNIKIYKTSASTCILQLKERISIFSDFLQYLHNLEALNEESYGIFNLINKYAITKVIFQSTERFINKTENSSAALIVENESTPSTSTKSNECLLVFT